MGFIPGKTLQRSFNPTLVRLRLFPFTCWARFLKRFQSYAGSIEAQEREHARDVRGEFQSHAGSIEAPTLEPDLFRALLVSIPRWFD